MPLHPVLLEKLNAALAPAQPLRLTRRDARLPAIAGKVHAVIGMRRSGKTTFLRQLQTARREGLAPERAVFVSFDDDRLAELAVDQLPAIRRFQRVHPGSVCSRPMSGCWPNPIDHWQGSPRLWSRRLKTPPGIPPRRPPPAPG